MSRFETMPESGQLVIISGPSGVGKTTVLKRLYEVCQRPLTPSVSATTRPQRPGEVDGQSYFFLSDEEFQRRRDQGEFLECVEVFGRGHWYGTLQAPVEEALQQGRWVVLEIDVEGAQRVLKEFPSAITIFIHPGSLTELEQRLRGRGTESESALERRLEVAQRELEAADAYRHIVINQTVDQTVHDICQLLEASENETRCTTN